MQVNPECPHCGLKAVNWMDDCLYVKYADQKNARTEECYERQLSALKEQVAELRRNEQHGFCEKHQTPPEFFGYIGAAGGDLPGEDWRCLWCENERLEQQAGKLREALEASKARVAALEECISNAPHDDDCTDPMQCDCWISECLRP